MACIEAYSRKHVVCIVAYSRKRLVARVGMNLYILVAFSSIACGNEHIVTSM